MASLGGQQRDSHHNHEMNALFSITLVRSHSSFAQLCSECAQTAFQGVCASILHTKRLPTGATRSSRLSRSPTPVRSVDTRMVFGQSWSPGVERHPIHRLPTERPDGTGYNLFAFHREKTPRNINVHERNPWPRQRGNYLSGFNEDPAWLDRTPYYEVYPRLA